MANKFTFSPRISQARFFGRYSLFFAMWGLFFANSFYRASVLYSEPSASDWSISQSYQRTFTFPLPRQPPPPQKQPKSGNAPGAFPRRSRPMVVPAWHHAMNPRLQCPPLAETIPAKAGKARNYMAQWSHFRQLGSLFLNDGFPPRLPVVCVVLSRSVDSPSIQCASPYKLYSRPHRIV